MVTYEVTIKELGYRPEPYAIADALMYADGKPIVEITDMSLRLTGTSREELERLWTAGRATAPSVRVATGADAGLRPRADPRLRRRASRRRRSASRYRPFDDGRFIARLPGPPYSVPRPDRRRSTASRGRWPRATAAEAEYDVPPDAWYFAADRQDRDAVRRPARSRAPAVRLAGGLHGLGPDQRRAAQFRNLGGTATPARPGRSRASGTLTTVGQGHQGRRGRPA